jgi:hypothetical protein
MIYESSDLRLPLAFRVGVTGRRELKSDAIPLLRAAIEAFLAVVRNEIVEFASADIARAVYRSEERGPRPFMLRVVSPLARARTDWSRRRGSRPAQSSTFHYPFLGPNTRKTFRTASRRFVRCSPRGTSLRSTASATTGLRKPRATRQSADSSSATAIS